MPEPIRKGSRWRNRKPPRNSVIVEEVRGNTIDVDGGFYVAAYPLTVFERDFEPVETAATGEEGGATG